MFSRTLQSIIFAASVATGISMSGCSQREQDGLHSIPVFDASTLSDAGLSPEPRALTNCGDAGLVDLLENDENCGACGVPCAAGMSCYEGECRVPGYRDLPCGPDGWCPRDDLSCIEIDGTRYCVERNRWGCEFHAECDQTERELCVDGECVIEIDVCLAAYCSPLSEELCDGRDNDRDGVADDLPPHTCYSGPAETRGLGICRSGVQQCVGGSWTACEGERLPVMEEHILLCDGRDNDCDGCADNMYDLEGVCTEPMPQEYDIVFIIDLSGSMHGVISSVSAASLEFASTFDGDPNFRFALLGHPFIDSEPMSRMLELPLADYSVFRRSLGGFIALSYSGLVTGNERNYDVPYMVASGAFPIGFRPEARRVYINFTDELGQTYPYPGWPEVDETLMCSAFRSDDIVAFVTEPHLVNYFDECAFIFELRYTPSEIAAELRSLFTTVCTE